jgi:hypothetical protein
MLVANVDASSLTSDKAEVRKSRPEAEEELRSVDLAREDSEPVEGRRRGCERFIVVGTVWIGDSRLAEIWSTRLLTRCTSYVKLISQIKFV